MHEFPSLHIDSSNPSSPSPPTRTSSERSREGEVSANRDPRGSTLAPALFHKQYESITFPGTATPFLAYADRLWWLIRG